MSSDAQTLLYWIRAWNNSRTGDYAADAEFWAAREWAAHIIAGGDAEPQP